MPIRSTANGSPKCSISGITDRGLALLRVPNGVPSRRRDCKKRLYDCQLIKFTTMANDNEVLRELTERVNGITSPDVVKVELEGNIAIISGTVRSLAKKNEIAMTASYVAGVEGIDNRLVVHAPEYIF